jgi:LPS O-antigen subunit length determinant protein (WzzB/FepE family)
MQIQEHQAVNGYTSRSEMTLLDFINVLRCNRWIVIGATLLLFLIALAYVNLATRVYSASVVMIPSKMDAGVGSASRLAGSLGGLVGFANLDLGGGAVKDEAIAVLKSRQFTEQFLTEENLLPELYADLWDSEKKVWIDPERAPSMGAAFRRFDQSIRFVREDVDSGVFTLEILWTDPVQAAQWANALVRRLNERMRTMAIAESENSLRYLHEQLKQAEIVELRRAIAGLVEQHVNRIMVAKVRPEYAFQILDPAVPPDIADFVSPRPMLTLVIATVLGALLGVLVALARHLLSEAKSVGRESR